MENIAPLVSQKPIFGFSWFFNVTKKHYFYFGFRFFWKRSQLLSNSHEKGSYTTRKPFQRLEPGVRTFEFSRKYNGIQRWLKLAGFANIFDFWLKNRFKIIFTAPNLRVQAFWTLYSPVLMSWCCEFCSNMPSITFLFGSILKYKGKNMFLTPYCGILYGDVWCESYSRLYAELLFLHSIDSSKSHLDFSEASRIMINYRICFIFCKSH